MRRFPLIRWVPLGAVLALAVLPLAARHQLPCHAVAAACAPAAPLTEADHTPPTVLATPASQPPSPFLAATGLALKVPAADLGGMLPRAGATTQHSTPSDAATRTSSIIRTRLRVLRLRHGAYAADGLAARAGLLARRATAPPPPIG